MRLVIYARHTSTALLNLLPLSYAIRYREKCKFGVSYLPLLRWFPRLLGGGSSRSDGPAPYHTSIWWAEMVTPRVDRARLKGPHYRSPPQFLEFGAPGRPRGVHGASAPVGEMGAAPKAEVRPPPDRMYIADFWNDEPVASRSLRKRPRLRRVARNCDGLRRRLDLHAKGVQFNIDLPVWKRGASRKNQSLYRRLSAVVSIPARPIFGDRRPRTPYGC